MGIHTTEVGSGTSLLSRLENARRLTDDLFTLVRPDALYDRTIPERHRIVFYIGHLEAFDWNLLGRGANLPVFNADYDKLFAFGIDPVDGNLPSDQPSDWPSMDKVEAYRAEVRRRLDEALQRSAAGPEGGPLSEDLFRMNVAIEHRLMHAETLGYIVHHLPHEKKTARTGPPVMHRPNLRHVLVQIPSGTATLGLPRHSGRFGWCNEFGQRKVSVPAFRIDRFNTTNGQYLEFMADGGYRRPELWSEENWAWKESTGLDHPFFWARRGEEWLARGMFAEFSLPLDWPVYVSQAEAAAFARWKGLGLPTEAQFHRAAYGTPEGTEREYPWGDAAPDAGHGNFDFHRFDAVPVGSYPAGDSAFGIADLLGNGWEWTSSLFEPFEGFEAFPYYPGYSANFFDGQHYVIKGASPLTAGCMLRRSFRNWFQPRYPYIYATFRCVESA